MKTPILLQSTKRLEKKEIVDNGDSWQILVSLLFTGNVNGTGFFLSQIGFQRLLSEFLVIPAARPSKILVGWGWARGHNLQQQLNKYQVETRPGQLASLEG